MFDSSGIHIAVSDGASARARSGWYIDSLPNLQLGQIEGDETQTFSRIGGIASLSDGKIVVVDGGSSAVRIFDPGGRHIATVGRSGRGPGEFMSIVLVPGPWTDSVLVFDRRLGRFATVSGNGARSSPAVPVRGQPKGLVNGRVLVAEFSPWLLGGPDGLQKDTVTYSLVDLAGGPLDTLEVLPGQPMFVTRSLGELPAVIEIPITTGPSAAVGRGSVYVTDGSRAGIREYDVAGVQRRIIRLDEPDRQMAASIVGNVVEAAARRTAGGAEGVEAIEGVYARMPIPTTAPTFRQLLVDQRGYVWAELYPVDPQSEREWIVFDSTGGAVGTVAMPASLEVHEIGQDYVLGRWKDEMGVEYVRRHPLHRN